jgi:hypothetical protein
MIKELGEYAFYKCIALTKVEFADGLEVLGTAAFHQCTLLEEAILPDSIREMGDMVFSQCLALKKVKLPATLGSLGIASFAVCQNLKEIELPETCASIGEKAFMGCESLEVLALPEAIRTIGARMVDGCTHFHDNFGEGDIHTLPFYGKVDWESVMKALADIGYQGDLSYEALNFIKDLPRELCPAGLTFMAEVGRYLIGRFEYHRSLGK